jgi:hypothetical protein
MARAVAGSRFSDQTAVRTTSNAYCGPLGISPARIEDAKSSPDANYYSLLIICASRTRSVDDARGGGREIRSRGTRSILMTMRSTSGSSGSVSGQRAVRRCEPRRTSLHPYHQLFSRSLSPRCVRLRSGFLDEMLPAPWVHRDESTLYHLLKEAHERDVPLEVVAGTAPGWADPWSRARRAFVATDTWHSPSLLADEQG